jgi:hypothetical protein
MNDRKRYGHAMSRIFWWCIRDVDEVSPSSHIERGHETQQTKPPL